MICSGGPTVDGEVCIRNAHIGQLVLDEAHFRDHDGIALQADRLKVDQGTFFQKGHAEGVVSLGGAQVGGQLVLNGSHLANPSGIALAADSLTVGQDVSFADGFTADGEMQMPRATIGGAFDLRGHH